jgi:predicted acetyltransferase
MAGEERPLAVLMPFKQSFYARMGYAPAFYHYECEFAPGQLALQRDPKATLRAVDGIKCWRTIEDLHQRCSAHRCGTVRRDVTYAKRRWLRPAQGLRRVYLVERSGNTAGFVIATLMPSNQTETPNLVINQAAWADADALRAILSFIRGHRDQVLKTRWFLPVDVDLYPYFEDPNIQMLLKPKMMLKLVDLKGAIERRRYPADLAAELILDVTADETSPWNEGRWRVTWDKGCASVRKVQKVASGTARVRCDLQTLAVMYSGHRSASMLEPNGLLTLPAKSSAVLDQAFPLGAPFMQEWF